VLSGGTPTDLRLGAVVLQQVLEREERLVPLVLADEGAVESLGVFRRHKVSAPLRLSGVCK